MKILLVDDEEDIRRIAKLSLARVGGHEVLLAASAPEAIEAAKTHRPDAILLDMMMPGADGLDTLGRLRKIPEVAAIPVVFMTAKVQRHEIEEYVAAGAVGVIQKPFDPMALPGELARVLGSAKR
jgi:CheY-like chemotaxis protein